MKKERENLKKYLCYVIDNYDLEFKMDIDGLIRIDIPQTYIRFDTYTTRTRMVLNSGDMRDFIRVEKLNELLDEKPL